MWRGVAEIARKMRIGPAFNAGPISQWSKGPIPFRTSGSCTRIFALVSPRPPQPPSLGTGSASRDTLRNKPEGQESLPGAAGTTQVENDIGRSGHRKSDRVESAGAKTVESREARDMGLPRPIPDNYVSAAGKAGKGIIDTAGRILKDLNIAASNCGSDSRIKWAGKYLVRSCAISIEKKGLRSDLHLRLRRHAAESEQQPRKYRYNAQFSDHRPLLLSPYQEHSRAPLLWLIYRIGCGMSKLVAQI